MTTLHTSAEKVKRPAQVYLCTLYTGDKRAGKLLSWLVSWSRKATLTVRGQSGLWNANATKDMMEVIETKSRDTLYRCFARLEETRACYFITGGFEGKKMIFTQPSAMLRDYLERATTTKEAKRLVSQLPHFATPAKPLKKYGRFGRNRTMTRQSSDNHRTMTGQSNTFCLPSFKSFKPSKHALPENGQSMHPIDSLSGEGNQQTTSPEEPPTPQSPPSPATEQTIADMPVKQQVGLFRKGQVHWEALSDEAQEMAEALGLSRPIQQAKTLNGSNVVPFAKAQ